MGTQHCKYCHDLYFTEDGCECAAVKEIDRLTRENTALREELSACEEQNKEIKSAYLLRVAELKTAREALEFVKGIVCSAACLTVWVTSEVRKHSAVCNKVHEALGSVGEDGKLV
jgi:hypothetical protein